jgi:MFS family permease
VSRRRRFLVLGICSMSLLIVGLDTTIVNVALPSIRQSLHASVSGLQWTIDAGTLVPASLLMLSGSTADRVGRRRTFQAGLVVFCSAPCPDLRRGAGLGSAGGCPRRAPRSCWPGPR